MSRGALHTPSSTARPAAAAALPPPAIDAAALQAAATEASAWLRSLAHPTRLMLLCALAEGERCVADLEAATGIGQPSLSQQLGVLRRDALVLTRREGKFIHYRLASPAVVTLLHLLQAQFCAPPPVRRASRKKAHA